MAFVIKDNLYRISLDSERNFVYVCAKDPPELIRFLVDQFVGSREIFAAKQVNSDGTLSTVQVITNPVFQSLCAAKLAAGGQGRGEERPSLGHQIQAAEARQGRAAPYASPSIPDR